MQKNDSLKFTKGVFAVKKLCVLLLTLLLAVAVFAACNQDGSPVDTDSTDEVTTTPDTAGVTTPKPVETEPETTEPETPRCTHVAGDWIVDVPAKIGAEGSQHKECRRCGELLETSTLAALVPSEGLHFTSNDDGTCYVSGMGTCTDTDLVIPLASPNGDSVTGVGGWAFRGCDTLTSVAISDSVTSIGDSAFYGCSSLASIVIPDSVTSIGNSMFANCTSLTRVTIGNNVTKIGGSTFSYCDSLVNVTIGSGVTMIDRGAFSCCSSLTGIVIPDNVTSIGEAVFMGCGGLTSVTVGNGVTSIGESAFSFCHSLTDVYYTGNEGEWKRISIKADNADLTDATIHYNYVPQE